MNMRYVEEVCSGMVRAVGKGESVCCAAAEPARTDNSTLWLLKG